MSVYFHSENIKPPDINLDFAGSWIKKVIKKEKSTFGDINIIFCTDTHLLSINKQYLNRDNYTDVISFNYSEKKKISGDIYISVDRVKDNATKYKVSFSNELHRIIIHGVLHLLEYDDYTEEEKQVMHSKENIYLGYL